MALETKPFDAAKYITSPEEQRDFIDEAFETGHTGHIANALGIVARARGVSEVARAAEITRVAIYKGLTEDGDPRLSTLLGLAKALGFRLTMVADAPSEMTAPTSMPAVAVEKKSRLKKRKKKPSIIKIAKGSLKTKTKKKKPQSVSPRRKTQAA